MPPTGHHVIDSGSSPNASDVPKVKGPDNNQHIRLNGIVNVHEAPDSVANRSDHDFPNGFPGDLSNGFSFKRLNIEAMTAVQHDRRSVLSTHGTSYQEGLCPEPIPIAICGLALRLPGGIRDAETFWDALLNGKDMRSTEPHNRYNSAGSSNRSTSSYGYFLDEDLTALDTSFFNMRKSELEVADPQQRQLLEVTRECLENAGEVKYRGKSIGCYVGTFGDDWLHMMSKDGQSMGANAIGGFTDMMQANRVSYEFDFQGPRYAQELYYCFGSLD